MQALDLIALNISSQHVFPIVAAFVREVAGSQDENQRAAALTALAVLSEGCSEALRKRLKEVLPLVLQGLQDPVKGGWATGVVCIVCGVWNIMWNAVMWNRMAGECVGVQAAELGLRDPARVGAPQAVSGSVCVYLYCWA
jgi:hypothetical protein